MLFAFSHRKASQALNFFALESGGGISKLKALELVYFADRYHLRCYGRPVVGDEYLAMDYGPVPSATNDLAEFSEFLTEEESRYGRALLRPVDRHTFASAAPVDPAVFSASDREALDWAWRHFGRYDGFALAEMTHAYPEWRRHETALQSRLVSRAPMNYRDFLDDPPEGVEPCHPLTTAEREAVASGLSEIAAFQRAWR